MEKRFSNRLRELRTKAGFSQASVADMVGISDNAYQRYEYGERDIPGNVLLKLAECFDTTSDYILEISAEEQPGTKAGWVKVPLYGRIAAGDPLEMDDVEDWGEVPAPVRERHPDSFLLTVDGESMNRVLPNGCRALVERCSEVNRDGKPYAVCVNGYDATIKRVRRLETGFELIPDSDDPTFKPKVYDRENPDDDEITVIGRVVYHVMPYDWEY